MDVDNIKSVELAFENGEAISIERKYIGWFYLGKFERIIRGFLYKSLRDSTFVDEVHIEINAEANANRVDTRNSEEQYPFERLNQWKDIARITLEYYDGTEESFPVNYDESKGEGRNAHQKNKTNSFGDLYIVIGDGVDIDEIFPDADINDGDRRKSVWNVPQKG